MRAALRMWHNTRMIVLTAVCSAIYAAALVAFKTAIPLIPGITEVRVANMFPMSFGLLFGPAGAWGSAMGNLIGDLLGGTLGPGSVPGFIGNFLLGYLPYTLWTTLLPFRARSRDWSSRDWKKVINYVVIAFVSSASCAIVIGASIDALGIAPYAVLSKIITVNNMIASLIGILLLTSVFNVIKQQFGLFWADVMEDEDIRSPKTATLGAWFITVAAAVGLIGGSFKDFPGATVGWACVFVILIGGLLL